MVFSWVPTGRLTGEEAKKARGANPLVRAQGDSALLLKIVPEQYVKKDFHDESIKTIPYSILELLLLPGVAIDPTLANKQVVLHLLDPKVMTELWAKRLASDTDVTGRRSLDDLFEESLRWAKERIGREPPTAILVDGNTVKVHRTGNGEFETEIGESKLGWVRELKFGLLTAPGQQIVLDYAKVVFMLGERNTEESRAEDGDIWTIGCLMQELYTSTSTGGSSLPARFKLPRMLKEWATPMVPHMLQRLDQFTNIDAAVAALLNISAYPMMSPMAKNLAIIEALPAVSARYPGLHNFMGETRGAALLEALAATARRRCTHHFHETLSEDVLRALDEEFTDLQDRFKAHKATTMSDKLKVALSDAVSKSTEEEAKSEATVKDENMLVGVAALQKSQVFLQAIEALKAPLGETTVDTTELITTAFQSKCLAVMKHLAGKGDHSKLDPILKQAAPYRNPEFKVEAMLPVAEAMTVAALAEINSKGVQVLHSRLETYSLSQQAAFDALEGLWGAVDWPMELVHRPKSKTEGRKIPHRGQSMWYLDGGEFSLTELFEELTATMVPLFTKFFPYNRKITNGIEAMLAKGMAAAKKARSSKIFAADIKANLNTFMRDGLRDAGKLWRTAWKSTLADMPVPLEFIPSTSKAAYLLDKSIEQAERWLENEEAAPQFTAAIQRVMDPSASSGRIGTGTTTPPPPCNDL